MRSSAKIFKLHLSFSLSSTPKPSKLANEMFPRDGSFVPILVHICIIKPPIRKLRSKSISAPDCSQPLSSTGIINIGANHTIETMKERIITLLGMESFGVDKTRDDGNWLDVGELQWMFAQPLASRTIHRSRFIIINHRDSQIVHSLSASDIQKHPGYSSHNCPPIMVFILTTFRIRGGTSPSGDWLQAVSLDLNHIYKYDHLATFLELYIPARHNNSKFGDTSGSKWTITSISVM
jgi:hypothetical protein